ncbi:hypothetical protein B0H66DRAFT_601434 [Apodospora peruviana]|uniref:Uncharacterized protein n=1 Tax=Apodospora peruviana TaxID=516989 RepID=A0AAE0IBA5_9PEZI|nr:hypothetical protein B0H66DRAFT_601434 [Apodospora peruviana]
MASTGDSSTVQQQQQEDKGPWNKETKVKFELKNKSEFLDPCQEAAQRSIRCLNRNDGDRSFCTDYFQSTERRAEEKRDDIMSERAAKSPATDAPGRLL